MLIISPRPGLSQSREEDQDVPQQNITSAEATKRPQPATAEAVSQQQRETVTAYAHGAHAAHAAWACKEPRALVLCVRVGCFDLTIHIGSAKTIEGRLYSTCVPRLSHRWCAQMACHAVTSTSTGQSQYWSERCMHVSEPCQPTVAHHSKIEQWQS